MEKLVHVCLTAPYVYGMGYDENIMPYYHKQMGYDVYIISFSDTEIEENSLDDNKVFRLKRGSSKFILSKFGVFLDLYETLDEINPQIIYVHNAQFISFPKIIKYKRNHPEVKIYVDNHDDYYNSHIKGFKPHILFYVIYRSILSSSAKYVEIFWGVTPWRCRFLTEVFGVPKNKVKLLVMGGDDRFINLDEEDSIKESVRTKYDIYKDDFLIISGGKINKEKGIHILAQAISEIDNPKLKLILFGKIEKDIESILLPIIDSKRIIYVGWMKPQEYYELILASDLGFYPGTHSILWEQTCACGIPIVVKDIEDMHHVDVGGNAYFIEDVNLKEIISKIEYFLYNKNAYEQAKKVAKEKATKIFSYKRISSKAISNNDDLGEL